MKKLTTYRYEALDSESYIVLAEQMPSLNANVILLPEQSTILVTPFGDTVMSMIAATIDDKGLSFHIDPVELDDERGLLLAHGGFMEDVVKTFDSRLEDIGKQSVELEELKKRVGIAEYERDYHARQAGEAAAREAHNKKQIQALCTLLESVFE